MATQTLGLLGYQGSCMMARREVFEAVGGFDEELTVSFNDVDFCLKLREAGYLVVYTPLTELVHHESRFPGPHRGLGGPRPDPRPLGDVSPAGDPYYNDAPSKWRDWCPISTTQEDERGRTF